MQRFEKILIVDRDNAFCREMKEKMEHAGYMCVDTVPGIELMRYMLDKNFYNIVIGDKNIVTREDVEYIRRAGAGANSGETEIILLSETESTDTTLDVGGKTVYCLKKPVDFAFVNSIINEKIEAQRVNMMKSKQNENSVNLERNVTGVMHSLGIPAHIKGYQFLRTAIIKAVNDPEIINYITKSLYPSVAKAHGTTPSRVERAIRHAIEVAWDRGDVDTLNSYFGYTISRQRGKPTNSEFIALLTDKLRLQYGRSTVRHA